MAPPLGIITSQIWIENCILWFNKCTFKYKTLAARRQSSVPDTHTRWGGVEHALSESACHPLLHCTQQLGIDQQEHWLTSSWSQRPWRDQCQAAAISLGSVIIAVRQSPASVYLTCSITVVGLFLGFNGIWTPKKGPMTVREHMIMNIMIQMTQQNTSSLPDLCHKLCCEE